MSVTVEDGAPSSSSVGHVGGQLGGQPVDAVGGDFYEVAATRQGLREPSPEHGVLRMASIGANGAPGVPCPLAAGDCPASFGNSDIFGATTG